MNNFLKILLLVLAAVIAVKLLPFTLALGCALAVGVVLLTALALSVVAAAFLALLVLAALASPVWIPVLVVIGLVMLIRRAARPAVAA